tara:strand:+ start:11418 stop:12800 length:1383 start_codon:yes stop_codon:yes gene_type:complete
MLQSTIIPILYLISAVLFILGLKQLSHPRTARNGNFSAALGMFIAVISTLLVKEVISFHLILIGVIIGGLIGIIGARRVEMTSMPQLVAIFNGLGGGASLLVATAEFFRLNTMIPIFTFSAVTNSIFIGGITLTGSLIAFLKLQGIIRGAPLVFSGQHLLNGIITFIIIVFGVLGISESISIFNAILMIISLSLLLGCLVVLPIGGADMPVVISLLNSLSGLAAATTGFVLMNNALIISGSLVGASGIILTNIMCKGMNRTIWNVLFSSVGTVDKTANVSQENQSRPVKSYEPEDTVVIFENASQVIIVPGYGMAVAQAQQIVAELEKVLEGKGVKVKYAIHPVAGRMPGHMNVLLAEANVSYDKLFDLDDINPEFEGTEVALVIGANDVVNPAARHDNSSPLFGMPILDVDKAQTVFVLKRSMNPGFAGVENGLFFNDNTIMLFGDAKETIAKLVTELK